MRSALFIFLLLFFYSCKNSNSKSGIPEEEILANTERFNAAMDEIYNKHLSYSPVAQTYEGLKTNNDKWDINNDSTELFFHEMDKAELAFLKQNFVLASLDHQAQLTYRMYIAKLEESLYNYEHWRDYYYPVNQMFGSHTWFPSFLMNVHTISSKADAEAWLSRLSKIDVKIDELLAQLDKCTAKGVIAPKFVYPYVISDCNNLLKGAPFEGVGTNPLIEDFSMDLNELDSLSELEKTILIDSANTLMLQVFKPSYEKLIAYLKDLELKADDNAGVWKFENGNQYYLDRLKSTTTTDYTPQEIYDIGMSEIKRIHAEMEDIMIEVGFEGSLQEFFKYVKTNPDLYYPNTDEGREAYLAKNIEIKDAMEAKLDELFITKPKAALEVRRVEPYREKSAGTAFYNSPAPDGSRPGIYYANLYDMNSMPIYEMEALTYHEAIPGHHMQLSIAQEIENLPLFRTRDAHYTSYVEGWGLYAEFIPKEMGFYTDPYSDFGRLSMELFRAVRLVVDVGIHAKKWTREEGIQFYLDNTPNSDDECISMVERHIVMPSQATAYKIGQLKILELRERAKDELKDLFDIREFHEVVLTNGSVPLDILEELVDTYTASKKE
ncbi:MAG: DUF885 domain-containing protein [Bacteroidetes bacterium]|nr:DUF885 domain-containing protein [Bacteroidota bacterium]